MKRLMVILFWFFLAACGRDETFVSSATCTVKQGAAGSAISCPDGTNAFVPNGAAGANGTNGTNGINGVNGTNGTVVTSVQLCAATPHYPDVLPETALCINNHLYGVYSGLGGYLFDIAPGAYNSNAIGVSCTVTVLPNCQIQR